MLSRSKQVFGKNFLVFKSLSSKVSNTTKTLYPPICASLFGTSSTNLTKEFDRALPISEIPGPVKIPLLGNVYQVHKAGGIQNFNVVLKMLRKEYGDIFQLKVGNERMVCVADPDMIEDTFRKEGKYPRREKAFPAWVNYHNKHKLPIGVFSAEDEEWYRQRNALNPKLVNVKQVEHYANDFNKVIDGFLHKVMSLRDHNMEVDHIEKQLFKWSLESVCTVLFETHIGCFGKHSDPRYDEFIQAVHYIFDSFMDLYFQVPLIDKIVESKSSKDFKHGMDVIYKVTDEEIENKLKKYKAGAAGKIDEDTAKEFIPYLYYVQELSLAEIKSNIASLMMAAVDTTSTSMQFLLFNLSNNQKVQSKLHEEISSHVNPGDPATPAMLKKMPYLRAVMKESFRINPVVPFNARWFTEDRCIAGYKIPAKTSIFLLHDEACHNKAHFEDPEVFKPERWLRDNKGDHDIHPFASLPFGHGPRGCLGRRLAELEIQLLLARIFGKYVVECDKKHISSRPSSVLNKPAEDMRFKIFER